MSTLESIREQIREHVPEDEYDFAESIYMTLPNPEKWHIEPDPKTIFGAGWAFTTERRESALKVIICINEDKKYSKANVMLIAVRGTTEILEKMYSGTINIGKEVNDLIIMFVEKHILFN